MIKSASSVFFRWHKKPFSNSETSANLIAYTKSQHQSVLQGQTISYSVVLSDTIILQVESTSYKLHFDFETTPYLYVNTVKEKTSLTKQVFLITVGILISCSKSLAFLVESSPSSPCQYKNKFLLPSSILIPRKIEKSKIIFMNYLIIIIP